MLALSQWFRYAVLRDDPDQAHLVHALTLRQLALYVLETQRYGADRKRTLPLLLAALDPATGAYLVVGVWASARRAEGTTPPNEFGSYLSAAGSRIGARVRMTFFDSSGSCQVGGVCRYRRTKR